MASGGTTIPMVSFSPARTIRAFKVSGMEAPRREWWVRCADDESIPISWYAVKLRWYTRVRDRSFSTTHLGSWAGRCDAAGSEKLDAWIAFWGADLPQIFGVAKALMIAKEHDDAVAVATDVLWTMRSVANFEQLTVAAPSSTKQYVRHMQTAARQLFVNASDPANLAAEG